MGRLNQRLSVLIMQFLLVEGTGRKWIPSLEITKNFMQNFERNKDVDGAERFLGILEKAVDELGSEVFESLIRIYAAAGRTSQMLRRRVKMENVELSDDCKKLLDKVCVD
ncbi:hypothetical protein HYC85_021254 [Camellia sinensis]|uniref:MI domain-containing protein n=1 Tax=Camellia sinensis TaxID=4442 RepID=A0A7J7GHY6_CAMSI|nr:hypothetical protein HYC85_021254 [Camellia sinensis]